MSQVQIRQVSLATSPDAKRLVGSWFPSGYYGNFRARSRADLCNYFRQLARPNPPKKFVERQRAEATAHEFSRHDNRFKFECDPLVRGTQTGFGKRKSKTNVRGEFDPLFVSWVPVNTDRKNFVDEVKISSYADEYNRDSAAPHVIAEVQSTQTVTSNSENTPVPSIPETTAYTLAYGHGQPDSEKSVETRRQTFERFLTTRTRLLEHQRSQRCTSVASCLVWHPANEDKRLPTPNEKMTNIAVPITLQPRVIPVNNQLNANINNTYSNHNPNPNPTNNNNSYSSRQRAQSAGPRLMSSGSEQLVTKPLQNQPAESVKSSMTTIQRPHTATTTTREHYSGANFGLKVAPPPRAITPFERTPMNSMDSLVAKYM